MVVKIHVRAKLHWTKFRGLCNSEVYLGNRKTNKQRKNLATMLKAILLSLPWAVRT